MTLSDTFVAEYPWPWCWRSSRVAARTKIVSQTDPKFDVAFLDAGHEHTSPKRKRGNKL